MFYYILPFSTHSIPAQLFICLLFYSFFPPTHIKATNTYPERIITKEFPIVSDGTLSISNFGGHIEVTTGQSGVVKFEIVITATTDDPALTEKLITYADINFQNESSYITASRSTPEQVDITLLRRVASAVTMHFYVAVPPDINIHLSNRHGDIFIETSNRNTFIDLQDGKLSLGDVKGDLSLTMLRSKGTISQIQDGDFKLSHSILEMEDADDVNINMNNSSVHSGTIQNLELNSNSGKMKVLSVGQLTYNGREDKTEIESAGNLNAKANSSTIVLKELNGASEFNLRYCKLVIEDLQHRATRLSIDASYSDVGVQFGNSASFTISADLHHTNLQHSEISVIENLDKKGRHHFKAIKGSGRSDIMINMNYGQLKLEFN